MDWGKQGIVDQGQVHLFIDVSNLINAYVRSTDNMKVIVIFKTFF